MEKKCCGGNMLYSVYMHHGKIISGKIILYCNSTCPEEQGITIVQW